MDDFGQQILTRSGGTFDEHGGIAGGDDRNDFEDLLHLGMTPHHVIERVLPSDGALVMVLQGEIRDGGQPAHHQALLVFQGHVVGPDRNALAFTGGQIGFKPVMAVFIFDPVRGVAKIFPEARTEDLGARFPEKLGPGEPGDSLGHGVEKGNMVAPVDGQDADVEIVQNDFEAQIFEPNALDKVAEGRMVLKDFDAAQQPVMGIENRRFDLGQAALVLVGGDEIDFGYDRFDFRIGGFEEFALAAA